MNKWYAQHAMYRDCYELLCITERDGKRYYIETEFTQVEPDEFAVVSNPTLRLTGDEAQQIMNALWDTGLRPNNGTGAVAHTEALEAHLADMRTIAFNRLKIAS